MCHTRTNLTAKHAGVSWLAECKPIAWKMLWQVLVDPLPSKSCKQATVQQPMQGNTSGDTFTQQQGNTQCWNKGFFWSPWRDYIARSSETGECPIPRQNSQLNVDHKMTWTSLWEQTSRWRGPVWRRAGILPPQSLCVVWGDSKGIHCPGV
jgi:hypothetical protein